MAQKIRKAPPQVSEDGKFWWNGKAWVAFGAPSKKEMRRMSGQTLPSWLIGVLVAIAAIIALAMWAASQPGMSG